MPIDYSTVLQWIYLFNSLALIRIAFRQVLRRRKARQLDGQLRALAEDPAQWRATTPDVLVRKLGRYDRRREEEGKVQAYLWQGDGLALEARYPDGKCASVSLHPQRGTPFPDLTTYFNCSVLAALACAWKFLARQEQLGDMAAALATGAAFRQFLLNAILFLLAAWLLSFLLKRHPLLLSAGCIAMTLLSLPLLG